MLSLPDMVCLSHLRWDFVYQRPQHLMSRFARERRVFFVEEPIPTQDPPFLKISRRDNGVHVVVPCLPEGGDAATWERLQAVMIEELFELCDIEQYLLWYYTPMAMTFSRGLAPAGVIYDCMDELTAFRGAPAIMHQREAELLARADVVFTGGQSLAEVKRGRHPNVHAVPSAVETAHFAQARGALEEPGDQTEIPHPRLGYFGVIDERLDLDLLADVAAAHPDWSLVMIGPVTKIDPDSLPRRANIHYLGMRSYGELPVYLAGWDVALMPFARNEATRLISPTKTLEYLAAGKPVVSTSIHDVVHPYGEMGLVQIADTVLQFLAAIETSLRGCSATHLRAIDDCLAERSWESAWRRMKLQIEEAIPVHSEPRLPRTAVRHPLAHAKRPAMGAYAREGTGDV